MNQWEDKKDLSKTVTNSKLKVGDFVIQLFRRSTKPTIWICSIDVLGFNLATKQLASEKILEAKCQAKASLQILLQSALLELMGDKDAQIK